MSGKQYILQQRWRAGIIIKKTCMRTAVVPKGCDVNGCTIIENSWIYLVCALFFSLKAMCDARPGLSLCRCREKNATEDVIIRLEMRIEAYWRKYMVRLTFAPNYETKRSNDPYTLRCQASVKECRRVETNAGTVDFSMTSETSVNHQSVNALDLKSKTYPVPSVSPALVHFISLMAHGQLQQCEYWRVWTWCDYAVRLHDLAVSLKFRTRHWSLGHVILTKICCWNAIVRTRRPSLGAGSG